MSYFYSGNEAVDRIIRRLLNSPQARIRREQFKDYIDDPNRQKGHRKRVSRPSVEWMIDEEYLELVSGNIYKLSQRGLTGLRQ